MYRCNENVTEFLENQEGATVTFSQRKLVAEHSEECNIITENPDRSIYAHIPTLWIKISPPRQFTKEQWQQMGERLKRNSRK